MSAQLAVFSPQRVRRQVTIALEGKLNTPVVTRVAELYTDGASVSIHFDYKPDPSDALRQIDLVIESLHLLRHDVVAQARERTTVPA